MDKDEQELDLEDEISNEIIQSDDDQNSLDAALLDEDEDEDEFVQSSVDREDLVTGFSAVIPTREIDVDEDTQGDDVVEVGDEGLLTEFEVTDGSNDEVRGDEVQLDLEEALKSGNTITKAPDDE
ncbi:MAG TPA: hypothetical protein VIJ99_00415 [Acidimicrobiales bacterium]